MSKINIYINSRTAKRKEAEDVKSGFNTTKNKYIADIDKSILDNSKEYSFILPSKHSKKLFECT